MSKVLASSNSCVETPPSPAANKIPEWCLEYQRRIEAAQREDLLLTNHEEPGEPEAGQGEFQMSKVNTNIVQNQSLELAQQVMHVIQACNQEKDILENTFNSVCNDINILETRERMEKQRIESEVSGVESQMQLQQAVLQEMRTGISILQLQNR